MKLRAEMLREEVFLIGEGVCRQQEKAIMCWLASAYENRLLPLAYRIDYRRPIPDGDFTR
jgi:hypothetical protein